MIELLLLIYLCRDLFRRSTLKKENGWGWIFRYLSLVISVYIVICIVAWKYLGAGAIQANGALIIISVIGLIADLGIYFALRSIISKLPDQEDNDDLNEVEKTTHTSGDKDLSYFR